MKIIHPREERKSALPQLHRLGTLSYTCYNCNTYKRKAFSLGVCVGEERSEPLPQGGVGKSVLKFASVFAQEKRQILAMPEAEVGLEKFLESGKGVPPPFALGGVLLRPCIGGGKKKQPIWPDQARNDLGGKESWVGQAID